MINELLFVIEILIFFSIIVFTRRYFGASGLFAWITLATCLAEIQVCKTVELFGINATLGNVLFASTFLASDILRECYGYKFAQKAPLFSLLGAGLYVIFAIITPLFEPTNIDISQNAITQLFTLSIRVTAASIFMLFVANKVNVILYDKLHQKMDGKSMWLRSNVVTILCNGTENYLFTLLAFAGVFSTKDVLIIATSTTVIEIVVSVCSTPFLYWAKRVHK